jgi:hypothetical protein
VLWMIAVLLIAVAVTLSIPAFQATMRATNGNGSVYCCTRSTLSSR